MIILPEEPLARAIIERAQKDLPILEDPIGSNRSPEIDGMCRRWGVPLGSAWCALWVATVWADAGADIPPTLGDHYHPARAETWRRWALETGRFSGESIRGAAVLYGANGLAPATHIGACVVSQTPILMNFEGNTSETGFSREGEMTGLKRVNAERLIGFVHPHPITAFDRVVGAHQ